jgi:DNA topoisomerase-1
MYELIITEKPQAAKKIAEALADGKPKKESVNTVPYYKIKKDGRDIVVGCAVGHLYGLAEAEKKKGFSFPVFDIVWVPTSDISKDAAFSKKYLNVIKKLSKDANIFTVATDYDVEGEVIGLNVVRFACKKKDARRMKFSTLTKPDLIKSYEHASSHLDWLQAEAGETRHKLDWYYGINLSRAMTSAITKTGMFKILSTGRVQGPALKIIVDREKEIKAFRPVPFWQIELDGEAKSKAIIAWHKEDKFWDKKKAEEVMSKVKGEKKGKVAKVERNKFNQNPPVPFDLTTLQTEAYRCHKISPKDTLAIAQELYTSGYISYPRTSSQQLPPEINYKGIISSLLKQPRYAELCSILLKKALKPNNGKKSDPAHPAIYPTGIIPKVEARSAKIYDIIARRFLATFGDVAVRETMTISIDVKKELFIARGTRTLEKGWHIYYGPYVVLEEEELPPVVDGDDVHIKKITMHDKETQPPKRYTEASIIRELERRNLGTKSTRAQIIETLVQRNYVQGKPIEATDLGIHIVEVLEKYSPEIIDEELTRHFETDMESIIEKKKKGDSILEEAKQVLTKLLQKFKDKQKEIGEGLRLTFAETKAAMTTVGKCPVCKEGDLIIRKGKFGRFIACNKYPDCKTTFSLPAAGGIKVGEKVCESCGYPVVTIIRKGKQPQDVCINMNCPLKKVAEKMQKKMEARQCPKCKEGNLVLRKSVYGSFLGCSKYPNCRYTEKIAEGPQPK